MYRGHCRSRAYSKDDFANPRMENSVLYMAMQTPADSTVARQAMLCNPLQAPGMTKGHRLLTLRSFRSCTSTAQSGEMATFGCREGSLERQLKPGPSKSWTGKCWGSLPSSGWNTSSILPAPGTFRSVARYWSPNACLQCTDRHSVGGLRKVQTELMPPCTSLFDSLSCVLEDTCALADPAHVIRQCYAALSKVCRLLCFSSLSYSNMRSDTKEVGQIAEDVHIRLPRSFTNFG